MCLWLLAAQCPVCAKVSGVCEGVYLLSVFICREDASKAIDKLDGYGYDNLILRVEWAQPRAER